MEELRLYSQVGKALVKMIKAISDGRLSELEAFEKVNKELKLSNSQCLDLVKCYADFTNKDLREGFTDETEDSAS